MSRRKKSWLLAAMSLAIATVALLWPRPNWPAREALEEWRGLIDVQAAAPSNVNPTFDSKLDPDNPDVWCQVDVHLVKLCLNDASAGLFAKAGEPQKVVHGVARSAEKVHRVISRLRSLDVLAVLSQPQVSTLPGQECFIAGGAEIPVLEQDGSITNHHVGWGVRLRPQVGRDGELCCEAAVDLSRLAAADVASPLPRTTPPKIDTNSTGKVVARLRPGESLIIGGLTQRANASKTLKAPLLCDLPAVGSWFSWTYTRDVDEEWIVLITPSAKPAVHTP